MDCVNKNQENCEHGFSSMYLRIVSLSSAAFTISHQMLPVFWRSLCFSLYLFVGVERAGGRNIGSEGEAGGQAKHAPEVFILSLTRV
jgi:hypothetical protein